LDATYTIQGKKLKRIFILIITSFLLITSPFASTSPRKIKLYMAAALFNSRETRFNVDLVNRLEAKNFQALLPQRDGFEYTFLREAAAKYLPADEVATTVRDFIYLLDMGMFIPNSDVVVANLDEPIDDGVIVEISYAHILGKPVIGFRTDIRSPYGNAEKLGGLHSFVAFQCDYLIMLHMPIKNETDANIFMNLLADKITSTVEKFKIDTEKSYTHDTASHPPIEKLTHAAQIIFNNVQDIHSQAGLEQVIKNMILHKREITELNFVTVI
jgi:nucleoside 2-deoxyribosyltransferase